MSSFRSRPESGGRQAPTGPPPFPPEEWLLRRRRLRAGLAAAILIAGFFVAWKVLTSGAPPPARGMTGTPFRGLASSSADEALREAPPGFFPPLSWRDLEEIKTSELNALDVEIPDSLTARSGRPFSITGFMLPLDPGKQTLDFVLVPDMTRCWFCETPDAKRSIYARGAFGPVAAEYDRPVRASGVIDVGVETRAQTFHSAVRMRVVRLEVL